MPSNPLLNHTTFTFKILGQSYVDIFINFLVMLNYILSKKIIHSKNKLQLQDLKYKDNRF